MTPQAIDDLATRFFAAIEAGDLTAVRELYTADVSVWHNVTNHSQSREENLKLLEAFAERVTKRRYEILERNVFAGGFVQRHIVHGELASGQAIALPVAIVIHVADGRIERLYEYLDGAVIAPVFPSAPPASST